MHHLSVITTWVKITLLADRAPLELQPLHHLLIAIKQASLERSIGSQIFIIGAIESSAGRSTKQEKQATSICTRGVSGDNWGAASKIGFPSIFFIDESDSVPIRFRFRLRLRLQLERELIGSDARPGDAEKMSEKSYLFENLECSKNGAALKWMCVPR